MHRLSALTIVVTLGTATTVHAGQATDEAGRKEISATGAFMLPQGRFADIVGTSGAGGDMHALVAVGSGRAAVGGDAQLLFYSASGNGRDDDMVVAVHGTARLRRRSGPRRPFIEGVAGIKAFSTDTRIGTPSYGVGAGVQWPLRQRRGAPMDRELLEIGVRYLWGGAATVTDRIRAANTHAVLLRVGMALQF